jgi:hypothetical protein
MQIKDLARELRARMASSSLDDHPDMRIGRKTTQYLEDAVLIHGWARCSCGALHVSPAQLTGLVATVATAAEFLQRLDKADAEAHGIPPENMRRNRLAVA